MTDDIPVEYPKMLYRPGNEQSQLIWGYRLDTKEVKSREEEVQSSREGWFPHDQVIEAVKSAERRKKISNFFLRALRDWRTWVPISLIIAGLWIAYLSIPK